MTISPGTLCYIVKTFCHPEAVGRIVTAVGMHPLNHAWIIAAPWMPANPFVDCWTLPSYCLRPIHDPDSMTGEDLKAEIDWQLFAEAS